MIKIMQELLEEKAFDNILGNITIDNIGYSPDNISNPSIRFDAMNDINLGRVVLWSTGDMNIEILNIESMDTIYNSNLIVRDETDLKESIFEFIKKLKGN